MTTPHMRSDTYLVSFGLGDFEVFFLNTLVMPCHILLS